MDARVGEYLLRHAPLPFRVDRDGGDRALLIVETRPSFFLPHVIATAVRTHPGWALYVAGTPAVHEFLRSHCANYEDVTRITLDSPPRMTTAQYSHLLLSRRLWDLIREEHVLVFQSDCVLVRRCPDRMLAYDFVGAVCGTVDPDTFVMNGGLSVRRRSAMVRAIDLLARRLELLHLSDKPEDVAFCEIMRAHPSDFCLPSMRECMEFAIESVGDPRTAVGMHGTDKYYAPPELVTELLQLLK